MTRLKQRRKATKMTLRELATKVGKSIQSVHQQERLGIRTVRTAMCYGEALGVPWNELIDEVTK